MVKKTRLYLKCDTDGCDNTVERAIYLNGEYAQINLCEKCAKKLYDDLAKEFCDAAIKNGEYRNGKKKQ